MPDFATLTQPLIKLTEKNQEFLFAEDQQNSWEELKKRLISSPTLSYPDPDTDFILYTDASDQGIGAVLSQVINGQEKVIAYGSRVLTKQERRYCATRKELLAVVHFMKVYRHNLVGRKFVLRTDHASLRWLRSFKHPEGKVARWLEILDMYDVDLVHRPGKMHQNADALSRGPCMQCGGNHEGQKIRPGQRKRNDQVQPVTTRSRTKTVDKEPASNWLNSEALNLQKIRDSQQADPVISTVFDLVDRGVCPALRDLSAKGREIKYLWGQFPSMEISSGVLVMRLINAGMSTKVQILIPGDLRETVLEECHASSGRTFGTKQDPV